MVVFAEEVCLLTDFVQGGWGVGMMFLELYMHALIYILSVNLLYHEP